MRRIRKIPLWETAQAIATTAVITTDPIDQTMLLGDAMAIYVELAGTSVSVDIAQLANDKAIGTYKDPTNTSAASLGAIAGTLTASAWIQFTPVIAPFMHITITGDGSNGANTTAMAYLIVQEEI